MPHSTSFPVSERSRERFWAKVDRREPDSCWEWLGARLPTGYGRFTVGSVFVYAHRYSDFLANGDIPAGFHVCHSCDNPACVNPGHLFRGTVADNMADRDRKGRGRKARPPSERDWRIAADYAAGFSTLDLASKYGCCHATIRASLLRCGVVLRRPWERVHAGVSS
jgi:hypothetical protein